MYTNDKDIDELEARFGQPVPCTWEFNIGPDEHDMVRNSMRRERAHDITLFIRKSDDLQRVAVIRKPFFPPPVFRAPSGGADPGEPLENAAIREGREETGLDIRLTRYLARIRVTFTSELRAPIQWTSYVVEAIEAGGVLAPIDTAEIAEAKWVTITELQDGIRSALLETGNGLLLYRVALTDLVIGILLAGDKQDEDGSQGTGTGQEAG